MFRSFNAPTLSVRAPRHLPETTDAAAPGQTPTRASDHSIRTLHWVQRPKDTLKIMLAWDSSHILDLTALESATGLSSVFMCLCQGSCLCIRVGRAGYSYSSVRENIAFGYLSAKSVVMGWMCSDGHRKNIMSCDIKDIGVGLAQGSNGRWYHAQVFGCPRGGSCSCSGGTGSPSGATGSPAPEQPTSSPGTSGSPSSTTSEQPTNTPGSDSSSQYQPQNNGDGSGYGDYQQYYQQYKNQQGQQGDSSGSYDPYSGSQGSGYQESGGFFNRPGSQYYQSEDGSVTVHRGGEEGSQYTFVSARSGGAGDHGSFFGKK